MNAVAQPAAAPAPARFIDHGDGTVTVPALGLMFSKATLNEDEINHAAAEKLCADLDLAGHTDWRLPTVHELVGLVDYSRRTPAIDTDVFPDTRLDWYWTSNVSAWSSVYAWVVDFSGGSVDDSHRDGYSAFVRAVRSVPAGQ